MAGYKKGEGGGDDGSGSQGGGGDYEARLARTKSHTFILSPPRRAGRGKKESFLEAFCPFFSPFATECCPPLPPFSSPPFCASLQRLPPPLKEPGVEGRSGGGGRGRKDTRGDPPFLESQPTTVLSVPSLPHFPVPFLSIGHIRY